MIPSLTFSVNLDAATRHLDRLPRELNQVSRKELEDIGVKVRDRFVELCGKHYGTLAEAVRVSPIERDVRSSGRISSLSVRVYIDPDYSKRITIRNKKKSKTYTKKPSEYWKDIEYGRRSGALSGNLLFFTKKHLEVEKRKETRYRIKDGKKTGEKYTYEGVRNQGRPSKVRVRMGTGRNFGIKARGFMEKTRAFGERLLKQASDSIMGKISSKLAFTLQTWDIGPRISARWK